MELSLGIEMEKTIGIYTHDGFETTKGNPIDYILPVSLSYKISPGIITTFSVELVHQNQDAGGNTGFDRPYFYLEYIQSKYQVGSFIRCHLPFGSKGIAYDAEGHNEPQVDLGLIYHPEFENFSIESKLEYMYTFLYKDKEKQDEVNFSLEPELYITEVLNIFLGFEYTYYFPLYEDSEKIEESTAWGITVTPGFSYEINDQLTVDLSVSYVFAGNASKNGETNASWAMGTEFIVAF